MVIGIRNIETITYIILSVSEILFRKFSYVFETAFNNNNK